MKNVTLFLAALLMINTASAAAVCEDNNGSIKYESSTTVGFSVVITNPYISAGTKNIPLRTAHGSAVYYGNAACRAMGLAGGSVSELDFAQEMEPVAEFNEHGVLVAVAPANYVIKVLVCQIVQNSSSSAKKSK